MDRQEFVKWAVLNEICDDFENVDQSIFPDIRAFGLESGVVIERSEIVEALANLIEGGMAHAYLLLSPREPHQTRLEGMPSLETVEQDFHTYFWITPSGLEAKYAMDLRWSETRID